ncbi:MAG: hypothetical protein OEM98_08360 [Gammaproteobacteria bacterium]|nr:hypothetical protein [Gammaproteobacteria bacterium]
MSTTLKNMSIAFAAGAVGALANSIVVWLVGLAGITAAVGVAIAPHLSAAWLYPRIVWGGMWGLLFLLRLPRGGPIVRGLVLSLAPSLFLLLYVFPEMEGKGRLGISLGALTPVFVLFYNAVWGVTAALWLRAVRSGL